jgi:hypothetical protein
MPRKAVVVDAYRKYGLYGVTPTPVAKMFIMFGSGTNPPPTVIPADVFMDITPSNIHKPELSIVEDGIVRIVTGSRTPIRAEVALTPVPNPTIAADDGDKVVLK